MKTIYAGVVRSIQILKNVMVIITTPSWKDYFIIYQILQAFHQCFGSLYSVSTSTDLTAALVSFFLGTLRHVSHERGQSITWQNRNLTAVVWHDKRDVRLMSTNNQPTDGIVQTFKKISRMCTDGQYETI